MSNENASPKFGGRLKQPSYYESVRGIIAVLRGKSTLARIAQHLTAQGFLTPSDKAWTKARLAAYLRANPIQPAN